MLWFIAVVGGTVAAPSSLSADVASGKPKSFTPVPPAPQDNAARSLQDPQAHSAREASVIGDLSEGSGTTPATSATHVTSGLPQVSGTAPAAPTAALTSDLPQVFNTVPAASIAASASDLPQISATGSAVPTAPLNGTQGFDIVPAEATAPLSIESQVSGTDPPIPTTSEISDLSPASELAYLRPEEANIQFPAQYDEAKDTRWLLYTDEYTDETYLNEVPEGESRSEEGDMAARYDEYYSDDYEVVVLNNATADTAAYFPKSVLFANQSAFARIVNIPPSDLLSSAQPMGEQSISFDGPIGEQNLSNSSSIQPDDQLNPTITFSDQPQDLTGQSSTLSNRSLDIVDQSSTSSNQQAIYFDQSESDSISYPPTQSDQSTASNGLTGTLNGTNLDLGDPDQDEEKLANEEDKNETTAAILFPSRTVSCDPADGRGRQCCILQVSYTVG